LASASFSKPYLKRFRAHPFHPRIPRSIVSGFTKNCPVARCKSFAGKAFLKLGALSVLGGCFPPKSPLFVINPKYFCQQQQKSM
jgi:hypothetical protein